MSKVSNYIELLDYRRQVSNLYSWLRGSELSPEARLQEFRRRRDSLFASHPQSALDPEQKLSFKGLQYYPYNPDLRFVLPVETDVERSVIEIELEDDGPTHMERFGRIRFTIADKEVSLSLYWILGYGGGVFLPFRDSTNRDETYGGGRYLLDTIKSADLGRGASGLVIDFNYAYNPSCAYNPRWHCPLAPHENWLSVPIRAGELRFTEA